jgi:hypothetical protein
MPYADHKKRRVAGRKAEARYKKRHPDRVKAKRQRYKEKNRDKVNALKRAAYQRKKAEILAKRAEYREKNTEVIKAKKKEYYEANKEKIAAKDKKYREANRERVLSRAKQKWKRHRQDPARVERKREVERERWLRDPEAANQRTLDAYYTREYGSYAEARKAINKLKGILRETKGEQTKAKEAKVARARGSPKSRRRRRRSPGVANNERSGKRGSLGRKGSGNGSGG